MIPGRQYTPEDWLQALLTRKWVVLVPFALITTATIMIASRLPNRYRSDILILTVPQAVPQEYVRTTVIGQVSDRLPTISQQILSRSRLERIIRDFNLYPDARRAKPMEAVVERMRSDIEVQVVERSDSFRVSYEAKDPLMAMQVTERLAGLFIEENLHDREVQAHATSSFLESQLADARTRLVEQEKRLESYRLRYGAELPTQLQSNIQIIQNTQLQIQALNDGLNRDRDRRLLASRQLADLQSEQFLVEPGGSLMATASEAASISSRLEAAVAEVATLETRVTPEHPDLVRAKRLVAELESKLEKQAAPGRSPDTPARRVTPSEIAKRNRIRELQAELESVDRQIANKLDQEAQLRSALRTYQARVEAVPTRESELASLTRDYDTLQTLYRTLLAKEEDSKVAENLERRKVGDQFKIVDPPRRPERPYRPNRLLIDLAGALAGLAIGLASALLLEFFDKGLRVEADVQAALALPVVALIPPMMSGRERRRARWRSIGVSLALVAVFVLCVTAAWLTLRA